MHHSSHNICFFYFLLFGENRSDKSGLIILVCFFCRHHLSGLSISRDQPNKAHITEHRENKTKAKSNNNNKPTKKENVIMKIDCGWRFMKYFTCNVDVFKTKSRYCRLPFAVFWLDVGFRMLRLMLLLLFLYNLQLKSAIYESYIWFGTIWCTRFFFFFSSFLVMHPPSIRLWSIQYYYYPIE